MPFCPKCRDEFQDWFKFCPDCGESLVDKLEPIPKYRVVCDKLVTIASFSHPEEAHITAAKLEAFGIRSFVADEYVVTANWLYSTAVGGVKVKVKESDVEEALKLLEPVRHGIPEHFASSDERCPRCNSPNIHYETFFLRPIFLIWLFFDWLIPIMKRKWKCRDCGFEWKQGKDISERKPA